MADYSYAPGGYVTADEPIASFTAEGEDKALHPWQVQSIHTLRQGRREVSFSLQFPRQPQTGMPLWLAQLFGVTLAPAPPTVREAAVDVWDALRVLLGLVWATVRGAVTAAADRVGDRWFGVVYGVLDRWDVLRGWGWRRQLVGPIVRLWSASFVYQYTMPRRRETWREWLRRQAGLPLAVWRG
ncbi:hypothetical protein ANGELICA_84 [Mycobacterium phage Angelica]|uniref:Uncharacterized protein n=1 Tax=Mycobacterium phage Angelica TaxID=2902837 RepID=E0YPY9_9CAUD|nr:hypothetical protein ANGELICA_84 [Mycobacterium phage Angelica]ADL71173.1 hypothetical protein ANGELICA_84 [Mycobacterium phage Angelica]